MSPRPLPLIAGAAPARERRFGAAVSWEVTATGCGWTTPFTVHVRARSAPKALRTARREKPGCVPIEATLTEPPRVTAGTLLASLPETEHRVKAAGSSWTIVAFADGMVSVGERGGSRSALIPSYIGRELRTVGDAVRTALPAADRYRVIGQVAMVLLHGVVLSAPPSYESAAVNRVTVGHNPAGRGGYACVTDPGGVFVPGERTAFFAALLFVDNVGAAGAVWALGQAREKAAA